MQEITAYPTTVAPVPVVALREEGPEAILHPDTASKRQLCADTTPSARDLQAGSVDRRDPDGYQEGGGR